MAEIGLESSVQIIAAVLQNDVHVSAVIPIFGRKTARFHLDFLRRSGVVAGELISSSAGHGPVVHAVPQLRKVS